LLDEQDQVVDTVSFEYNCPKAIGPYNVNKIKVTKGESLTPVSQGLYAILGNDIEMDINNGDQKEAYLSMYDNDGVLRVEIPLVTYRAHRLLFDENGMYFSVSGSRLVRMDRTGYVNRVYKLGSLLLHHDYLFGNRGDIVVLGTDTTEGTKEDVVFSIDLETKKIRTIIDLKTILPDYYKTTTKPKSAPHLDWMHINSFSFVDEESIILSSRETSTIIKLDNIYENPTIDYMIGSKQFWEGTGYEQYLLTQEGEFSLHAGQHTVTYTEGPEGKANQYYIYLYNNNNTISSTRPSYKWSEDPSYGESGIAVNSNGANSYYYKYLVDAKKRTFTLMNRIKVDYSGYVSSAQEYQGNVIIDSGFTRTTWEYDSNGQLIQEVQVFGNNSVYRTFKYDFDGYWFKNRK
ncbi:MAG: aryl-sulfate sulfotransferase, partial [Clostridiales bacterium]|nr:aryl-sulfate sulfotransferase [Clostridiales bacterium]